ncbi:MAG TPA: GNAT family N-acetyltransferase [Ramlibacter sp.]|nr:GNAT family N-acetyltransferase [Ramlibacter sp.]
MTAAQIVFGTARLSVRRFVAGDEAALASLLLDPATTEFLALPPISGVRHVQAILAESIAAYAEETGPRAYAVESQADGQLVGFCASHSDGDRAIEIMYALGRAMWGRGLGWELARALTHHCEEQFPGKAISAYVVGENAASIRILEKLAFRNLGWSEHQGFAGPVLRYERSPP